MASLLFLTAVASVAQTSDSQTLQEILREIRQLRQDLAGTIVASQRVQILLYRLQLQRETVKSAMLRHDQIVAKVKDAERNRLDATNGLKAREEKLASMDNNDSQRSVIEAQARDLKRRVEMWTHDEGELRADEIAADSDLKHEQATLADLQQKIDEVEHQLQNSARTPR